MSVYLFGATTVKDIIILYTTDIVLQFDQCWICQGVGRFHPKHL